MVRARVWLTCAAMHDPVSPVLLRPALIGWDGQKREVNLVIERPFKGLELLSKMKGWVTVDVERLGEVFGRHGRLKLLDDRELVVECEGPEQMLSLERALERNFGDQVRLEYDR
ncbi:MAG: hypothetical protein AB1814_14455 [Thermodesulfobacteriota bacterium]